MTKSSILLVVAVFCFFSSAVVAEKESSSFDVKFAKSNQRLYKWYPPFKHFPALRYFSKNDANTFHVNEDKSDQTRRVLRDDRGGHYDIGMLDRFIISSIQRQIISGDFPFDFLAALSLCR